MAGAAYGLLVQVWTYLRRLSKVAELKSAISLDTLPAR